MITVWKELAELEATFELMIELVATTPLVVLVKILPVEESVLVVEDATKFWSDVAATTPLTVDVSTTPLVERALELITEDVAIDPPIFEVIILPDKDSVFGTERFVTLRFVVVALVAIIS